MNGEKITDIPRWEIPRTLLNYATLLLLVKKLKTVGQTTCTNKKEGYKSYTRREYCIGLLNNI